MKGLIDTGKMLLGIGTAGTAAANGASQAQFAAGQATLAGIMGQSNAISDAANTAASAVDCIVKIIIQQDYQYSITNHQQDYH